MRHLILALALTAAPAAAPVPASAAEVPHPAPPVAAPVAVPVPAAEATHPAPPVAASIAVPVPAAEASHPAPPVAASVAVPAPAAAAVTASTADLAAPALPASRAEAVVPTPPLAALRPTLLAEIDHRTYGDTVEGNSGFAIARLRPGLALTPAPGVRAAAVVEFASERPAILDTWLALRAADWAEVTIGYSKPPLFASFAEPVHTTPVPDRAPVVTAFRVRRDVGIDLRLTPRDLPVEARLRIGNGTGSALGNDNALPAGYAAVDLVLGRARRGSDAANGLRLGVAGFAEDARDRDGIVGQTPLGFVYARPVVVSGRRLVGEAHAIGWLGPLRLTIEGAASHEARTGDDGGDPATARVALDPIHGFGATAELVYLLVGDPRRPGQAPGPGAFEAALRYDGLWLARGADDVRPTGGQGGAAGLKWWAAEYLAASLTGYLTRYDEPPIEAPDRRWSWGLVARASLFWGLGGGAPPPSP
ncbi:MAG: hypothetical protein R3F65_06595 [bacterium]